MMKTILRERKTEPGLVVFYNTHPANRQSGSILTNWEPAHGIQLGEQIGPIL